MTGGDDRRIRERIHEFLIRRAVNTKARLGRFLRPGSFLILLLVTAAGAGAVLRDFDVPDASFWRSGGPAAIALAVVAALSYVGYCAVVYGYQRVLKNSASNARLYTICRDVAALVERETDLERDSIGVHVWTVRGLRGIRRLERRASFVPVDRPSSVITWRKGKGVLGQCWASDNPILADLEPLSKCSTARAFDELPRSSRYGFTWHEAMSTQHYTAVLAWPLHGGPENARRVVGVMSVDVQAAAGVEQLAKVRTSHRAVLDAHRAVCEAILQKG